MTTRPNPDHALSHWTCPRGHRTKTHLLLTGDSIYRGSNWDFCSRCRAHPTAADVTRMTLQIAGKWLRDGNVTIERYRDIAHDPRRDRRRLQELAEVAKGGGLDPRNLDPEDRLLLVRASIGLPV